MKNLPYHMLSTMRGGVCTYEIQRDSCITFAMMSKLCRQLVQGESLNNKINSTDKNAQIDIKSNGLCGRHSAVFFDVKFFNPLAKSCPKNSVEAYKYQESLKCLKYEQRIYDVEKSNFVTLMFSCLNK